MTIPTPLLWLLALIAGALIPVQAAANSALSRSVRDNVPFAAMALFVIAGLATEAFTFMGGIYSSRRVRDDLAPALRDRVLAQGADVVLLVPV